MTTRSIEDGGRDNPLLKNHLARHRALLDCTGEIFTLLACINTDDVARTTKVFKQKLNDVLLRAKVADSESDSDRKARVHALRMEHTALMAGTSTTAAFRRFLAKLDALNERHRA